MVRNSPLRARRGMTARALSSRPKKPERAATQRPRASMRPHSDHVGQWCSVQLAVTVARHTAEPHTLSHSHRRPLAVSPDC